MGDIAGLVLPFFGIILLGAVVARITRQPIEALGWLNTFVVYIALPALFFQLISQTPVERLTEWRYIAASLLATYLVFVLMFAASMLYSRGNTGESTIKGLAASYGNIGYMGPGLALIALGPEAAVPVALIFCFENIAHFTVAPMMMALAGGGKGRPLEVAAEILRKIALHPFIIATAAGAAAAYGGFSPPVPVERLLNSLAQAAAPCALFAMGVTLALRPLKRRPPELGVIAILKLLVHPLLCYVMLALFGSFDETWVHAAVLLAALPTATNVYVLAQQYGTWVERASASVLVTTVMSVITVSGLIYLIRNGYLPANPF
jgi:malonate transporter and related proteins